MKPTRRTIMLGGAALLNWPGAIRAAGANPIEAYEQASGGRIGVRALNVRTGASISWRADERFIMCSTFKASLAAFVLQRADHGKEDLEAPVSYTDKDISDMWAPVAKASLARGAMSVKAMCKAAVDLSDSACANLLLIRSGGPAALTAFWRSIGDQTSRLDHYEPDLNRSPSGGTTDSTTPTAMADSLQKILLGDVLSSQSRALLTDWLIGSRTGNERLRAGLPKSWRVGDKTGSSGRDMAGDLAIAWPEPNMPIIITAFTRGGLPTEAQFKDAFVGIGRLVASTLA